MLKVIAEDFIKPEHLETVRPWYAELVEKTRQEPLCIAYDLFVDQKDPGHFVFIEHWPDHSAGCALPDRALHPFGTADQCVSGQTVQGLADGRFLRIPRLSETGAHCQF